MNGAHSMYASLLGMLVLGLTNSYAQSSQPKTVVKISVVSFAAPNSIELLKDGDLRGTKLTPLKEEPATYETELANPFLGAPSSLLSIPYVVAATWGVNTEEIYLEARRGAVKEISADIVSLVADGKREELDQIERLGKTTYRDQMRRYFWARAHHNHWRFNARNLTHQNAIRSAKEWFDASYWLATRRQTYFRMDPKVVTFFEEYERMAAQSSSVRKTYNSVVRPGYIEKMLREVDTAQFQLAAVVEDASGKRDFVKARALNAALLENLEARPKAEQAAIRSTQGITVDVLMKNEEFFANRIRARE